MSQLSLVSLLVGGAGIALFMPALLLPGSARKWCTSLPRNAAAGWVLTAVVLVCAEALLYTSSMLSGVRLADIIRPLSGVSWVGGVQVKHISLVLTPVAFFLVVLALDELLAARALGGLLVLIPRTMLDAAFLSHSRWKLAINLLAYVMVVAGIILILSPFRFRQAAEFLLKTDDRSRLTGVIGVATGLAIVILALTLY